MRLASAAATQRTPLLRLVLALLIGIGLVGMHVALPAAPSAADHSGHTMSASAPSMADGGDPGGHSALLSCGMPNAQGDEEHCGMGVMPVAPLAAAPKPVVFVDAGVAEATARPQPRGLAWPQPPDLDVLSISRT